MGISKIMKVKIITITKNIFISIIFLFIAIFLCEISYRIYEFHFYKRQLRKLDRFVLEPLPNEPILQFKLKPKGFFLWHENSPFKINSYGFRDYEYDLANKNDYRIIILGDSYTFGWGVKMEKTFPKVLESSLKKQGYSVQVVNAGIYGYNTQQEVLFFEKELLKYKPDLVIISFVLNDTRPQGTVPMHPFTKNYESYFHSWFLEFIKLRVNRLINKREHVGDTWKSGDFYPLKVKIGNPYLRNEDAFEDDFLGWRRCKESLSEIKKLSEQNRFILYLIILPSFNESFINYRPLWIHEKVKKFAQNEGIIFSDFYRYFARKNYLEFQNLELNDDHPNEIAHQIIGERLSIELENLSSVKEGLKRYSIPKNY